MPSQDLANHVEVTSAEREVLWLIKDGQSDADIATSLDLSVRAVESRLRRFAVRSGLSGRPLVAWTVRHEACCLARFL